MKKLNKNILFSLGTLAVIAAPVAAVVACGDSKKETTNNNTNTNNNNPIKANPVLSQSKAWDATTQTIDLAEVKDQFELVRLLSDVTALKNMKDLSAGFNQTGVEIDRTHLHILWDAVKTKFEHLLAARPNETDITIKFGTESVKFNLGIYTFIKDLIKAIPAGDTATAAGGDGFALETNAGAPILSALGSRTIIQSLLSVNNTLAMGDLMKLTHLPTAAFEQFKGLVVNIQTSFESLINSSLYKAWTSAKQVNIGLDVAGKPIDDQIKGMEREMFLGAHFLVEVLENN